MNKETTSARPCDVNFPGNEVARALRTTCRDLNEVVRVLDLRRESDLAGRLHTLTIELRQVAAIAEMRADVRPATGAEPIEERRGAVAIAH